MEGPPGTGVVRAAGRIEDSALYLPGAVVFDGFTFTVLYAY